MKLHQIAPVMSRILFVVVVLFLGAMRAEARTTAKLLGSAGRGKPSDGADRLEVGASLRVWRRSRYESRKVHLARGQVQRA